MGNFIWNQYGKTRYFKHRKCQNLGMNNKVRDDEMLFVSIFFHIC